MPLYAHHDAAAAQASGSPTARTRQQRLGLAAITIAAFFMAADITITNVALPSIAADLDASMSALQWVVDSYNITVAGLLLLGAALAERYSRKWVFLGGILLFSAGSVLAGLAPSIPVLVGARTVMGVGGALVLAPAISLIAVLFPPDARARAVAAWSAAGALGLAVSPILGGLVLSVADWHWVFLLNVPAMVVTVVLGARVLPPGRDPQARRLDVIGAILSVLGLALTLGAVIEAPSHGWTNPVMLAALLTGLAAVAGFVLWELHCERPMFDVRVLARRGVLGASLGLMTAFVAFNGGIFLITQQLQVTREVSPIELGLALVPFALGLWWTSGRAAGVARRRGPVATILIGGALLTASFVILSLGSRWDSVPVAIAGTILCSAGCGLVIPIGSVIILNDLPASLTGSASGTSMLARFAGASIGVAVLGTVLAFGLPPGPAHADPGAFDAALDSAYLVGVAFVALLTVVQWGVLRRWSSPVVG